jgi:thiol-disulfide isomerase/thioredoxin
MGQNTDKIIPVDSVSFSIKGLNDKAINVPDIDGRLTVINFWSVYCRVCVKEIPELNKLIYEYSPDDVVFIALSADTKEEINSFKTKIDYLFTTTYTDRRTFIDLSKLISGSIALPFTAIVDGNGKLLYHQGFVSELDLDKIKEVLNTAIKQE